MSHYIIFSTETGSVLVFVCVDESADIKSTLTERADGLSFKKKEDVAAFMDKYINDVQKPDYRPYWHFVDALTI